MDKKELELAVKKAVELLPNSPDGYNARAMIGITALDHGCKSALDDMTTAEKIATTIDTLTIGAMVYLRCGDLNKAIASRKKAITLAPNDTNWVITGGLVTILYQAGRTEEIYEVVGEKINLTSKDKCTVMIAAPGEAMSVHEQNPPTNLTIFLNKSKFEKSEEQFLLPEPLGDPLYEKLVKRRTAEIYEVKNPTKIFHY